MFVLSCDFEFGGNWSLTERPFQRDIHNERKPQSCVFVVARGHSWLFMIWEIRPSSWLFVIAVQKKATRLIIGCQCVERYRPPDDTNLSTTDPFGASPPPPPHKPIHSLSKYPPIQAFGVNWMYWLPRRSNSSVGRLEGGGEKQSIWWLTPTGGSRAVKRWLWCQNEERNWRPVLAAGGLRGREKGSCQRRRTGETLGELWGEGHDQDWRISRSNAMHEHVKQKLSFLGMCEKILISQQKWSKKHF